MGALVMLLVLVIVVAATATVVTLAVMNTGNANRRRLQLPPPQFPPYPVHRLSAADRERIMVLLRGGQKIQAIKLYREATGAGLREAKEAVEHMQRYQ